MNKFRLKIMELHIVRKVYVAPIVCLFVFLAACANAKSVLDKQTDDTTWMVNDVLLKKNLNDTLFHVLFTPDTVKCYHIIYKENIQRKEDVSVLSGYIRDSLITILNNSQKSVLQFLLPANSNNYFVDSVCYVQSPYFPILEFEFQKKNYPTLSIVMSPLNHVWQIVINESVVLGYNYADCKAIERYCNVFMNIGKNE